MNNLVKIIRFDDGSVSNDNRWHLIDPGDIFTGVTLCKGDVLGDAESNIEFEEKAVMRGGITCKECIKKLKKYKSIAL